MSQISWWEPQSCTIDYLVGQVDEWVHTLSFFLRGYEDTFHNMMYLQEEEGESRKNSLRECPTLHSEIKYFSLSSRWRVKDGGCIIFFWGGGGGWF